MDRRMVAAFFVAALLMLGVGMASGEDEVIKGGLVPEYGQEEELLWVWGPVVSVDPQKREITIKYFDYDDDQEKEMALTTDDKTSFENMRSLEDIHASDSLSIDYVESDGKKIARNISVEKPEELPMTTEDVPPASDDQGNKGLQ